MHFEAAMGGLARALCLGLVLTADLVDASPSVRLVVDASLERVEDAVDELADVF